ncbi:MAG TPA: helix-turn-helix transcriptional regulator [Clostridia bacterium]|nr:helix-turn-helix transcriptional regulator [Clostridia bacterium]
MASLGENIALYRRKKGLTQEALGEAAGVSMQAVSKWENGGLPDATLLPAIAKTLGVSIDALFGLEASADVEQAIAKDVGSLPRGERMTRAFELCWALERAIAGNKEIEDEDNIHRYIGKDNNTFSQMIDDSGITLMKLDRSNHYFFLSPEPEDGWNKRLENREAHTKLFALLSHPDVYDLLAFIYRRDQNPFTVRLIEKQLSIPPERSREILKDLAEYRLVKRSQLELDDETVEVYTSEASPSLIGFLIFANEMCSPPGNFSCYCHWRERPYFKGGNV